MTTVTGSLAVEAAPSRWARFVSNVLSPPVIWAVLAFPIALQDADNQGTALLWALEYSLLVCWLPVLYIAWCVRCGTITDIHMRVRQQRLRPFLVTLTGALAAFVVLRLSGAPHLMPMFALFSFLQLGILMLITLVWQISIHAMSITGAVVAAGALYGVAHAVVLLPLIVLVGAARVRLKRHTVAQIIAGGLVGGGMTLLLFALR